MTFSGSQLWVLHLLLAAQVLQDARAAGASLRSLQQQDGCAIENCSTTPGSCQYSASRGWRCRTCMRPFVSYKGGMACVCPAGDYLAAAGCMPCPLHHYCPLKSNPIPCPSNLLTAGTGRSSLSECANPPGYRYVPSATNPRSLPCERDEYSQGLRFQLTCNRCPTDFGTDPTNRVGTHTSSLICVAPPGFLMISSMVALCPKGTYSSTYTGNYVPCAKCSAILGPGVTTPAAGGTSPTDCSYVELGFVAMSYKGFAFLSGVPAGGSFVRARPCPMGWFCRGGDPGASQAGAPVRCPNGLTTQSEGATTIEQCVAPPGHYYMANDTGGGLGFAVECPDGWFKDGWDRAQACTPCGVNPAALLDASEGDAAGWRSNRTVAVPLLDPNNGKVASKLWVRGSSSSCYLRRGMGSQQALNASSGAYMLRASYCPTGDSYYGIPADRYGLDLVPCYSCPSHLVTSCDGLENTPVWGPTALDDCVERLAAAAVASGGGGNATLAYASQDACMMRPGWALGNVTYGPVYDQQTGLFPQECPQDTYSPGGVFNGTCIPCNATSATNTSTNGLTGQARCQQPA